MKWFDRWFSKKCKQAWEDAHNEPDELRPSPLVSAKYATTASEDWSDGLNIRIHTAMGGKIVSFNRYDRKSDRNNNTVYVIPDDHDFEKELGKLITLESMKG